MLSKMWKELDSKGKQIYNEMAKLDKLRYKRELEYAISHK